MPKYPETATETAFRAQLIALLNSTSREQVSHTPDYILAVFLRSCLQAFDIAVISREVWYGRLDTLLEELVRSARYITGKSSLGPNTEGENNA